MKTPNREAIALIRSHMDKSVEELAEILGLVPQTVRYYKGVIQTINELIEEERPKETTGLKSYTPRQLLKELKDRGYEGIFSYKVVTIQTIDLKDL